MEKAISPQPEHDCEKVGTTLDKEEVVMHKLARRRRSI